eukprot:44979-Chlamydomonas_euryale.AAC.1
MGRLHATSVRELRNYREVECSSPTAPSMENTTEIVGMPEGAEENAGPREDCRDPREGVVPGG